MDEIAREPVSSGLKAMSTAVAEAIRMVVKTASKTAGHPSLLSVFRVTRKASRAQRRRERNMHRIPSPISRSVGGPSGLPGGNEEVCLEKSPKIGPNPPKSTISPREVFRRLPSRIPNAAPPLTMSEAGSAWATSRDLFELRDAQDEATQQEDKSNVIARLWHKCISSFCQRGDNTYPLQKQEGERCDQRNEPEQASSSRLIRETRHEKLLSWDNVLASERSMNELSSHHTVCRKAQYGTIPTI